MKRWLLLALLCVLSPLGLRAQTSVSGNLKDAGLTNITSLNSYVRFTLAGYGSNIPRVTGTNAILTPYKDFHPDASGNISGTIQGNDTITIGGNSSPGGTWYQVCLFDKGIQFRCATYTITGGSFNLNNATPNTTTPTVPAPTGDNTYLRKDAGNSPVTGALAINNNLTVSGTGTLANVSKILFVDGVTNTSLAATLALCPAQGCFIFDSFQETLSANPFASCPAPNADVTIFLSTNIITNVPIVDACNGLSIRGTGRSGSVGFTASGSFPSSSVLFTMGDGNVSHFLQSSRLEDLSLNCNNNTTCTPFVGSNLAENSGAKNVAVTNFFGTGFSITGPTSTNFEMQDLVAAAASTATTAIGLKINGIFTDRNAIKGFTSVPQAGGTQSICVDVEGSTAHLDDIHCESSTTGVLYNNSYGVITGYSTGNGASGTITDHIKLTGTSSITVFDASACSPNYGTNLIHNVVTSFTLPVATTCVLTSYMSGNSTEGDIYFYPGIGAAGETHTGDITASNFLTSSLLMGSVIKNASQTVTMGLTLKKGSGSGNYTNATTSYAVADATNLCYTVTIPTGWKLGISASGALSTATGAVVAQAALTDNAACSTANAGILVETAPIQGAGIGIADAFGLDWVITGDGAAHNIALQFKTSNVADTASLINSSATITPTMKFELMPSN